MNRKNGNGIAYDGHVADYDVCAMGKSHQLAQSKKSKHATIMHPFCPCMDISWAPSSRRLMEDRSFSARSRTSSPIGPQSTFSKDQALASLHMFVTSAVIPLSKNIIRWRADKGGEFTGDEFKAYSLETSITQECAATNTPQ